MAELHPRVEQLLTDLEKQRDELKVRMHLAKAEGRDEMAKLEAKLEQLRTRFGRAGAEAQSAAGDVGEAAKLLAGEIRDGFARVKRSL